MGKANPDTARRIRALREGKGLTVRQACEEMRRHTDRVLPEPEHLERRWKSWESLGSGASHPGEEYQKLIAATLGVVTSTLFLPEQKSAPADLLAVTGMDTLEILGRLQVTDVSNATLDGLRVTVERLCSSYASQPAATLIVEGRQWLARLVEMQETTKLTLAQRRDLAEQIGWLVLLVGCLEYDLGAPSRAEGTRRFALSLGKEIEHPGILGWAHEMKAWFALTGGEYRAVIAASEAGETAARDHSVAVQLAAQQAKAYARMGQLPEMHSALERGRVLLDNMPYPENTRNHFVVDPLKYDFYAMDCYRHVGDDRLARTLADEVIRGSTDFNGNVHSPMRVTEAQVTLGVAAAHEGELDEAVEHGQRAISGERKSLPSLAMVTQDLVTALRNDYADAPAAKEYVQQLRTVLSEGRPDA
ncbi:hypothetical protein [Sciscionella marina]|uniref:hypothetical protein n=1 Tax=Sciscionella marina TaxID=508770 RepID=UPI000368AC4A|nr:hypothetical protein [Sciscionella marina]